MAEQYNSIVTKLMDATPQVQGRFYIAGVAKPRIGTDFLREHKLLVINTYPRRDIPRHVTVLLYRHILIAPGSKHFVTTELPIAKLPRRLLLEKLRTAKTEFAYMTEQSIHHPSKSLSTSLLRMVRKTEPSPPMHSFLENQSHPNVASDSQPQIEYSKPQDCCHDSFWIISIPSDDFWSIRKLLNAQQIAAHLQAPLDAYLADSIRNDRRSTLVAYSVHDALLCLTIDASHVAIAQQFETSLRRLRPKATGVILVSEVFPLHTGGPMSNLPYGQRANKASPRQLRQLDFIDQLSTAIQHVAQWPTSGRESPSRFLATPISSFSP
ncbi:hypothetical protein ILUMI_16238 [Ignelater luminosus]|uniref:Uncharacterized protein n=1 Tax=Ignelater luminosus TaxID=2038154 RepID=A0A8K0G333_IGNLU|nr:hypothetical protein ILUMI_16238 [Ignelater luminosus]